MKNIPRKTHATNPKPKTQELKYELLDENLYATSDISFTAYLKVKYGLKVLETSRDPQGRCKWFFNLGVLNPQEVYNDFISGGLVSGVSILTELRNLKIQVHITEPFNR